MTKHPIEVITSVERRRRWSREDKERLVTACLEPGAVLSEIARAAGIHVSQLFRWRKELCRIEEPSMQVSSTLVPVIVSEAAPTAQPSAAAPTASFTAVTPIRCIVDAFFTACPPLIETERGCAPPAKIPAKL